MKSKWSWCHFQTLTYFTAIELAARSFSPIRYLKWEKQTLHLEYAVVWEEIICYVFYIYSPINFCSIRLNLKQQFYLSHIDKYLGHPSHIINLFKWRNNKIQRHLLQWSRMQVAIHLLFSSIPVVLFPDILGQTSLFQFIFILY